MLRITKLICLFASMVFGLNANDPKLEKIEKKPAAQIAPAPVTKAVNEVPPSIAATDMTEAAQIKCDPLPSVNYSKIVVPLSRRYGVDWKLVTAVIAAESNFDPCATSPKGAMGLMQVMPETAQDYEVDSVKLYNPETNISAGVRHLKMLTQHYNGDLTLAVAAYNAGQGTVDKYNGVPPYGETQTYVKRVLDYKADLKMASLRGVPSSRLIAAR
jgi:soluble lytic murein transglycosylase-like protein